jgi:hypothetical protein
MSNREYLSCADTAKLVRQALKESFPSVKFSVRSDSYSGGASIDVRWTDGPNGKQVDEILDAFEGAYFCGMTDYKGSVYHLLDGKPVRFGADFVTGQREISDAQYAKALKFLVGKYGPQIPEGVTVAQFKKGELHKVFPCGGDWSMNNSLQEMVRNIAHKISSVALPAKSATVARVTFAGDDGYGHGTHGTNGTDGDQCAKAISATHDAKAVEAKTATDAAHVTDKLLGAFAKGSLVLIPGGVQ